MAKPGPLAGLIGQLAMTGLGSAFGNMAAVTAASVSINNYLMHKQVEEEIKELLACKGDGSRTAWARRTKISTVRHSHSIRRNVNDCG